jgi:hypothetical protein
MTTEGDGIDDEHGDKDPETSAPESPRASDGTGPGSGEAASTSGDGPPAAPGPETAPEIEDPDEHEARRLRERRARVARTFRTFLVISLLAHSFFLPTPWTKALLALIVASSSRDMSFVPLDDEAAIPFDVELLGAEPPPSTPATPPATDPGAGGVATPVVTASAKPPPKPSAAPAASVAPPKKPDPTELDGGKIDDTVDAGPDAAADAGRDAETDAGADAAIDAGRDADADAAIDAGPDAAIDAGPIADAGVDADADAGPPLPDLDGGVAALHDASVDAASPASSTTHTTPDAGDGNLRDGGIASAATSGEVPPATPVRDPIGISGKAGSIAGKDPNVSLLLGMDAIRSHPAGATLGPMFATLPIWNQFFVGSGVDPVKDLDRILVAGPQFRESSKVVAVVKLKLKEPAIHDVLEGIRQRAVPPGEWESATVMTAVVDKTKRVFVMQGNGVLMVVPDSLGDTARKLKGASFPGKKGDAIVVFLKFPGKALRGVPFTIPSSLRWVRLATTLGADGSATTEIDALDANAEQAERSAQILTSGLEAATTREVPFLGTVRMIDRVVFSAVGDHVHGTLHLNPAQTRELAKLVAQGAANLGGPAPK